MSRKKLTYDFIKEQLDKEGYTLLSKEYINSSTKLEYICPKGHEHSITWRNWKIGHRCPYCVGLGKPTIDIIRNSFEKENYTLLSKEYINNNTKLKYICPNNHAHSIIWRNWQRGDRCPHCVGNAKLSIDFIKPLFEKEGYVLVSTEYKNSHTRLQYICQEGHRHSVSWAAWSKGNRCPYCAGNAKLSIDFVRDAFENEGYVLLSTKYINNSTLLNYTCPVGHRHSMIWNNWKKGQRCPTCINNNIKLTIGFIHEEFKKECYTLLSDVYINAHTKLEYLCPYNHRHATTWTHWQRGRRCPTCAIINNTGNGHYNWQGGKSFEPYCEIWKDKEFKLDIIERDAYICLNPCCSSRSPKDLTIHHINYNKKNCHPSNLITICRSCNSAANKDRWWHKPWYQAIMYRRYSYDYN